MTKFTSKRHEFVNKKPIIGGIILAAIIGVVFVGAQINPDNPENEKVQIQSLEYSHGWT